MSALAAPFLLIASGVRMALQAFLVIPFRVQFVLLWVLGVLFLLFNAPAFYGEDATRQTTILLMYTASLAFVFSAVGRPTPFVTMRAGDFLVTFVLWAVIGALLFKLIEPFNPERALFSSASLATLVIQALYVAMGEELLFRWAIPRLIPAPPMAAQVISAVLFGAMHFFAYGGNFANLAFATLLGLFFGALVVLYRDQGLVIAMSWHWVWNSYTLGYI